jgi:predicted nicotinamide N-methyase
MLSSAAAIVTSAADDDSLWGRIDQPMFEYTIHAPPTALKHLKVIQDRSICSAYTPSHASHGHIVWDAALVLAEYLQHIPMKIQSALELGAGIGVVGMTLAALGCTHVILSDQAYCFPLLEHNVAINFDSPIVGVTRPQVIELQWGQEMVPSSPFDLIVASDVLYCQSAFPGLVRTIAQLAPTSATMVLIAYETRVPSMEAVFFEQMNAAGFECVIVEWQKMPQLRTVTEYPDEIHIVRFQRPV